MIYYIFKKSDKVSNFDSLFFIYRFELFLNKINPNYSRFYIELHTTQRLNVGNK